ncbi:MAG TPA: phosphopantetheine-binding protein [Planctomycetota bacterium]|jgi:acyl carrier protein
MADEVADRTKKVISTILKVPMERVVPSAHFIKDLGMESVKSIELMAALEEEFDIEIDSDKVGDVLTVEKSIAYVKTVVG